MHQPIKQNYNHTTESTNHSNLIKEATKDQSTNEQRWPWLATQTVNQRTKISVASHPDSQPSQSKERNQHEVGEKYIEIKRVQDTCTLDKLPTNYGARAQDAANFVTGPEWPVTCTGLLAAWSFTETSVLTILSNEKSFERDLENTIQVLQYIIISVSTNSNYNALYNEKC
jgi:hypothetical protein